MALAAMLSNGTERGESNLKPHYSEFVRYCLRHYIRTQDEAPGCLPSFKTDAERENWSACHQVLKNYSVRDMDTVSQIYRPGDTMSDKIYMLAKAKQIPQDTIWHLVSTTEKKIAQKRGLI